MKILTDAGDSHFVLKSSFAFAKNSLTETKNKTDK